MSTPPSSRAALERHLVAARALGTGGLKERLGWLEEAASLAESAELDDEGKAGAVHLRAALGAIVAWSRGPKDQPSLVALDALVRTLMARGTLALLRSLSAHYDEMVKARAPHRATAAHLRDLLEMLARAMQRGETAPHDLERELARLHELLDASPETPKRQSSRSRSTPKG